MEKHLMLSAFLLLSFAGILEAHPGAPGSHGWNTGLGGSDYSYSEGPANTVVIPNGNYGNGQNYGSTYSEAEYGNESFQEESQLTEEEYQEEELHVYENENQVEVEPTGGNGGPGPNPQLVQLKDKQCIVYSYPAQYSDGCRPCRCVQGKTVCNKEIVCITQLPISQRRCKGKLIWRQGCLQCTCSKTGRVQCENKYCNNSNEPSPPYYKPSPPYYNPGGPVEEPAEPEPTEPVITCPSYSKPIDPVEPY